MTNAINTLAVHIFEKNYQVKCSTESIQYLQQAAQYLDQKMREIHEQHGQKSCENIAVMAALNISHELLMLKKQEEQCISNMSQRLQSLQHKIENALTETADTAA